MCTKAAIFSILSGCNLHHNIAILRPPFSYRNGFHQADWNKWFPGSIQRDNSVVFIDWFIAFTFQSNVAGPWTIRIDVFTTNREQEDLWGCLWKWHLDKHSCVHFVSLCTWRHSRNAARVVYPSDKVGEHWWHQWRKCSRVYRSIMKKKQHNHSFSLLFVAIVGSGTKRRDSSLCKLLEPKSHILNVESINVVWPVKAVLSRLFFQDLTDKSKWLPVCVF